MLSNKVFELMLNEKMSMSLILFQPGERVTVHCVPSHMIVSAFCFVLFSTSNIRLVLSLQLQWAAKVIVVNHPQ